MKKGFTIVEVSILLVIFLIVAFLVAPLSLNDTMLVQNTSRWKEVQPDFENIFYNINTLKKENNVNKPFDEVFNQYIDSIKKEKINPYRITFLNGTYPNNSYRFYDFYLTNSNAVISVKFENGTNNQKGLLMYDVNGTIGPNTWGKDIFGLNIYENKFEPFCKNDPLSVQKQDCSKNGSGLCCSNYKLSGGAFD